MRILYVGMKYDYGKPEQGYSFEHNNFFDCLSNTGHDILYFDFMTLLQQHGRDWINRRLLEVVRAEQLDCLFAVLFTDQFDYATFREISTKTGTTTINWFCDDHWRFDNYTRKWAPCFNWSVTTAHSALAKYAGIGYSNVIKSQWACNPFQYRKLDEPLKYEVTFVGQPHGDRREVISVLQRAGINVQAWGNGWENGRATQQQMIEIFNQSRINLNLTNSSVGEYPTMQIPGVVSRALRVIPFGNELKRAGKSILTKIRHSDKSAQGSSFVLEQIKGRNFEVPGCGGFLLSSPADNLEEYYQSGKEIEVFGDTAELITRVKHYLAHEDERATIAAAGYARTRREHTYLHRFADIFTQAGLPSFTAEQLLMEPQVSTVEEVG